jgi:oxygen-independent coproporphyrinogen-3 oxidase
MEDDWQAGGFGIYIHWPFCQAKCPYCDFNSHVTARIDSARWMSSYLSEIRRLAPETEGRTVRSVFFGGGTPSLMEPELVDAVLAEVRRHWRVANDWEVTLEANPSSSDAARFRGYRQAGVNRLSMGFQALNDADLKQLGRLHTVAEAEAAFAIARGCFERVSFDLIYARQEQTIAAWEAELQRAIALSPDHLSLYQLTIEDGTAFGDRFARGKLRGLPNESLAADMFARTQEICEAAGMPAYEVSNHCRPGQESQHNLIYWRYGDYLGIGPGAHGRISHGGSRSATESHRAPGKWLEEVETRGVGESVRVVLSQAESADEHLLMGLRLTEGIDMARHARLAGRPLDPERIAFLQSLGAVRIQNGRLATTAEGRLVLNAVLRELTADA